MMKPVPKGAIEPAPRDAVPPGLPEAAASEAAPSEAAASEDSVPPHAQTQITALVKSMTLVPPGLKMFRPAVGGFILRSAPKGESSSE